MLLSFLLALAISTTPSSSAVEHVGGEVIAPRVVRRVEPTIPPDKPPHYFVGGLFIFEAAIDAKGNVESVKLIRGTC